MEFTTLKEIEKLTLAANAKIVESDHGTFVTDGLKILQPPRYPTLKVQSLGALTTFAETIEKDDPMFVVPGYDTVELMAQVPGEDGYRELFCEASCWLPDEIENGPDIMITFGPDTAIAVLQTRFHPSQQRDQLAAMLSNLAQEETITSTDDGLSQSVKTKQGIVTVAQVDLPNPVKLLPYCTFPEAEPVEVPFLARIQDNRRGGKEIVLRSVDGGRWEYDAAVSVAKFLEDWLTALPASKSDQFALVA